MLQNNNREIVRKIAFRSMKQNRIRNGIVILAVILTTFMFTTIFTIGASLAEGMVVMLTRQQGTRSSIYLDHPMAAQVQQIEENRYLYAAGVQIQAGTAYTSGEENTAILLSYYDTTEFEKNYTPAVSDVQGSYPTQAGEVMLSRNALETMHITSPKIRMEISLLTDGETKLFTLSGWFTDYTNSQDGFQGFVSKAYADQLGLTAEKDGRLSISAKIGLQEKLSDSLDAEVQLQDGQDFDYTSDMLNETVSNRVLIAGLFGTIGLIIVFSGYLLIYNVMYISITKDIRFYGMLKTVGTTPKQIRKMVRLRAFSLSVVGIPVGMLLGTLASFVAVPYAMRMFGSGDDPMPLTMQFHPLIYVGTILFALFTIAVSCRKPSRLASRISPIEALKYQGQRPAKIKPKKGTDGGKLSKMAFRNVFREKKRAVLVFASLFLGTMAFLSTNAFVDSMKLENYVKYYLSDDYTIYVNSGSEADGTDAAQIRKNNRSAEEMLQKIQALDGITAVHTARCEDVTLSFDAALYQPIMENNGYGSSLEDLEKFFTESPENFATTVITISERDLKTYNQNAAVPVDVKAFLDGRQCILGSVSTAEQAEQMQGKTITMQDKYGSSSLSLEVGSCALNGDISKLHIGSYWSITGAPDFILVSETALEQLTDTPSINFIGIQYDDKAESRLNDQIRSITQMYPVVSHTEVRTEIIQEFQDSMFTIRLLCGGVSGILILIGVINFINVMLTGIFTRRTELAVMESVGMTQKQVRRMLMLEGIYYAGITLALILTLGSGILYLVGFMTEKTADYAVYRYPWGWLAILSSLIFAICILVPILVYRVAAKESITARLRHME